MVEHIKIHGTSLEGNLEGDAVDREALVFLPPSYKKETRRRYPVVYALHGYSIGAEQWSHEIHVPQTIEGAFAQGAKEMIVVLPDSKTMHNGSMYSSSVTTGDFEKYIAHDVVAYIDAHYRTIPERRSRGLVGHSMGGYGATRIGMKHRRCVRQSLHHESLLLVAARGRTGESGNREGPRSRQDAGGFGASCRFRRVRNWRLLRHGRPIRRTRRCTSTLPVKEGVAQPDMLAKWAANAPLAFVDQYVGNLRSYHGISLDVGDQDGLRTDTGKLHDVLDTYGIQNSFEIYNGTHTSAVADRFQNHVMPFFSSNLCFAAGCR